MTRASFGGGVADFVVGANAPGDPLRFAAATLTMWSAETGGTQYTDLRRNGVATSTIVVGADGQVPTFQGPDGIVVMWAEAGAGGRSMLDAAGDIAVLAQAAAVTATAAAASIERDEPDGVAPLDGSSKVPDANLPDRLSESGLSASIATVKAWARNPDQLIAGAVTRDANGAATSAPVVWPDGSPGTYTADVLSSAFPGAVDGYHVTYGSPVTKTFTQPTVTRDASSGAVTSLPAIVVT